MAFLERAGGASWVVIVAVVGAACGGVSTSETPHGNADGSSGAVGGRSSASGGDAFSGGSPASSLEGGSGSGGTVASGSGGGSGGTVASGGAHDGGPSAGSSGVATTLPEGGAQCGATAPCPRGTLCQFSVAATTVTADGTFAPHNVGAIWIEDDAGAFVKTLSTWGIVMLSRATGWESVSNGNVVDAVTAATRPWHGTIQATWDCTDVNHAPVPSGHYRVCMTFAEDASSLPIFPNPAPPIEYCVPFDETGVSITLSPPDDLHFQDVSITLTY